MQCTVTRILCCPLIIVRRLQEVTWLCREEVRSFPPYIHRRLKPVMQMIKQA